jgi:predicted nuclease of predicted toxin-antitoxin system
MKLLLDENLSRRIIPVIESAYPESSQIALLSMDSANDQPPTELPGGIT